VRTQLAVILGPASTGGEPSAHSPHSLATHRERIGIALQPR